MLGLDREENSYPISKYSLYLFETAFLLLGLSGASNSLASSGMKTIALHCVRNYQQTILQTDCTGGFI